MNMKINLKRVRSYYNRHKKMVENYLCFTTSNVNIFMEKMRKKYFYWR